jgi:hypothetical protein
MKILIMQKSLNFVISKFLHSVLVWLGHEVKLYSMFYFVDHAIFILIAYLAWQALLNVHLHLYWKIDVYIDNWHTGWVKISYLLWIFLARIVLSLIYWHFCHVPPRGGYRQTSPTFFVSKIPLLSSLNLGLRKPDSMQ